MWSVKHYYKITFSNRSLKDHYPLSGKLVKITSTVDINILDQTAQGVNPSLDFEYAM